MFDTISCKHMDRSPSIKNHARIGQLSNSISDCSHCNYLMASVKDSKLYQWKIEGLMTNTHSHFFNNCSH